MFEPSRMITVWLDGVARNDTSGNLATMSMWLSNALTINAAGAVMRETAHRYALIFQAIKDIHEAIGSIPMEVYNFRYRMMSEWLEWVKLLDPELHRIFNSCL